MTTARQQAREAVWTVPDDHPDLPNPNVYADITSDVWEPLLRPFVEGEPYDDLFDCGYVTCFFCLADEEESNRLLGEPTIHHQEFCIWQQAKEALGE